MELAWAVQVLTPHDCRPGRVANQRAKNRRSCDTEFVGPFEDIDAARAWIGAKGKRLVVDKPDIDPDSGELETIPEQVNRRHTADNRMQVVEVQATESMTAPEGV